MGAPSKRAKKIREASEFDIARLRAMLQAPRDNSAVYSWSLEDIYAARNAQMRGEFKLAARLSESMGTDDAIFVARQNRLAPPRCIKVELKPAKGARGHSVAKEAEALYGQNGVGVHPDTLADIHGSIVDHHIAVGYNVATPRGDGSRIDLEHRYWPIEFVRWDQAKRTLLARVDPATVDPSETVNGSEIPIVHGDGRWVVYQKGAHHPWRRGALVSAALVWSRHAFGMRDWSKSSIAHGLAKVIGALPEGVPLQNSDGQISADAAAFQELLLAIANSDLPIGIKPAGASVDFIANTSTAWQIFTHLTENAEKAAARIYLGTDGTLGTNGGAPGIDISALFGVASTIVQGDLECIERGMLTGVIEPWCAMNFGDSTLAPKRKYLLPDPDEDAARASIATRTTAFYAEIAEARANGFAISQAFVDAVAKKHGVDAPALPEESKKAPTIVLAPEDIARVVTVNEARASAGAGTLMRPDGSLDPDGNLTVEQFAAKKAAAASSAAA